MRRLLILLAGLVALALPAGASAAGCSNEALREMQNATALPECRAWEMVSPVDKNGANIMANQYQTRSATDGSAIQYSSSGAFGDAHGTDLSTNFIARRESGGWVSHGISPETTPPGFVAPANQTKLMGSFSSDLSTGLIYSSTPLTSAPAVEHVSNLYLRRDLLSPGVGSPLLQSNAFAPLPTPSFREQLEVQIEVVGATEDFHHVLFETKNPLTPEAAELEFDEIEGELRRTSKLYEAEDGTVRLVGIRPTGEASLWSHAGRSTAFQNLVQAPIANMISRDGSRVFWTDARAGGGNIYMRVNHSTTVQLNLPENGETEPQPATILAATPDGLHVFFKLAEGAKPLTGDPEGILYRYDVNAPEGHHLTSLVHDEEPADGIGGRLEDVLGISEDGSYVYFAMFGPVKLEKGQAELSQQNNTYSEALYLWHNGAVHFIGQRHLEFPQDAEENEWVGSAGTATRVTPGGELVFASTTPLTTYDNTCMHACGYQGPGEHILCAQAHCKEIYVYDPVQGRVLCASCDPNGAAPVGDAHAVARAYTLGALQENQHLANTVTADGSKVFFDSPDPLVPQDTNGTYDVYEYNVKTHEVQLLSSGRAGAPSYFAEATPSGGDVFFVTEQRLLGLDADSQADLYDARIGGGIASQDEVAPAQCAGEACQGGLNGAPALGPPASLAFAGASNAVPAPAVQTHAKRRVKKHARRRVKHRRRRGNRARGSGRNVSRRAGR